MHRWAAGNSFARRPNEPLQCAYLLKEEPGVIKEQTDGGRARAFMREWCVKARASGTRLRQIQKKKSTSSVIPSYLPVLGCFEYPLNRMKEKDVLTFTVACALLCLKVSADQKKFIAQTDSDWNVSENWDPPGIPGANDDVLVQGAEVTVKSPVEVGSVTVESTEKSAGIRFHSEIKTGVLKIGGANETKLAFVRLHAGSVLRAERIEMAPGDADAFLHVVQGEIHLKEGKGEIVHSGGRGSSNIHFEGVGSLGLAKCEVTQLSVGGTSDGAEATLEILPGQAFTVERMSIAPRANAGAASLGRVVISGGEVTVGNLKFNDGPAGTLSTAILELNAGTLNASRITRMNDGADQIFDWNGGTLASRESVTGGLVLTAATDRQKPLQIRLGDGGKQSFEVKEGRATIAPTAILIDKAPAKGTLVKSGGGDLEIQSMCAYTGVTTVKAGLLFLSGAGSINSSAGVVVERGAEFESNSLEPIPATPGWLKRLP
jgi:hypothetical protein